MEGHAVSKFDEMPNVPRRSLREVPETRRRLRMNDRIETSKVPEVTLIFWIIKVLATTLGETGGDAVSMSMNLGYALGSAIFIGLFLIAVATQIKARKFHPFL